MSITLTKPAAGSSGWAEVINQNWQIIQDALNGNSGAIAALAEVIGPLSQKFNQPITPGTKAKITYDANGLVTAGEDLVASDIPELPISKIANLQTKLTSLENLIQALSPDLSSVAIKATFQGSRNGLYVKCSTEPLSAVYDWYVEVRNSSNAIVESISSSSSNVMIDGDSLVDGETYTIKISIRSANSSWYTDTFQHTYISATIDVEDIVDALVKNNDAMTLFANTLAGSNILAQKVAEAGQAQSSK